jgi:hypothetical protein
VFFKDIGNLLAANGADWSFWSELIKREVAGVLAILESLVQFIASKGQISFQILFETNLENILAQAAALEAVNQAIAITQRAALLTQAGGRPGDRPKASAGDKAASDAQQRANKSIQLAQQALEEQTRNARQALERERQKDLVNIDEYVEQAKQLAEDHYTGQIDLLQREEELARRFIKNQEDLTLALTAIQQKRTKATNDHVEKLQSIEDEAQKRRDEAQIALERQLAGIRDDAREEELRRSEQAFEEGFASELEHVSKKIALLEDAHKQRLLLIAIELTQETTSAERKIELDNERIRSEQKFTNEKKRLSEERIRAILREQEIEAGPVEQDERNPIPIEDLDVLGEPPDISVWDEFFVSLQARMVAFSDFINGAFINSVHNMADALGDAVAAWALYGESIGKSLQKALAAQLAVIAAEATVQAALHAAYAIGKAAFGDFAGAAKHALAALKFAGVAVLTGVAAKAIAGNSFQSGGGGGESSGVTSTRNEPERDRTIREGRTGGTGADPRASREATVNVILKLDGSVLEQKTVKIFERNGPLRAALRQDLLGEPAG